MIVDGHPLDFGNLGDNVIDINGMKQELNIMIPFVYRFADHMIASQKCKSVTVFIVGSKETYSLNNKLFKNGQSDIRFLMVKCKRKVPTLGKFLCHRVGTIRLHFYSACLYTIQMCFLCKFNVCED